VAGTGFTRGWSVDFGEFRPTSIKPADWGIEADRVLFVVAPNADDPLYFYVAQQTYHQTGYVPVIEQWTEDGYLCVCEHGCRGGVGEEKRLLPVDKSTMRVKYEDVVDGMLQQWADQLQRWRDA
jgi:heptaprenylglyceryl phosphate synthase